MQSHVVSDPEPPLQRFCCRYYRTMTARPQPLHKAIITDARTYEPCSQAPKTTLCPCPEGAADGAGATVFYTQGQERTRWYTRLLRQRRGRGLVLVFLRQRSAECCQMQSRFNGTCSNDIRKLPNEHHPIERFLRQCEHTIIAFANHRGGQSRLRVG